MPVQGGKAQAYSQMGEVDMRTRLANAMAAVLWHRECQFAEPGRAMDRVAEALDVRGLEDDGLRAQIEALRTAGTP